MPKLIASDPESMTVIECQSGYQCQQYSNVDCWRSGVNTLNTTINYRHWNNFYLLSDVFNFRRDALGALRVKSFTSLKKSFYDVKRWGHFIGKRIPDWLLNDEDFIPAIAVSAIESPTWDDLNMSNEYLLFSGRDAYTYDAHQLPFEYHHAGTPLPSVFFTHRDELDDVDFCRVSTIKSYPLGNVQFNSYIHWFDIKARSFRSLSHPHFERELSIVPPILRGRSYSVDLAFEMDPMMTYTFHSDCRFDILHFHVMDVDSLSSKLSDFCLKSITRYGLGLEIKAFNWGCGVMKYWSRLSQKAKDDFMCYIAIINDGAPKGASLDLDFMALMLSAQFKEHFHLGCIPVKQHVLKLARDRCIPIDSAIVGI